MEWEPAARPAMPMMGWEMAWQMGPYLSDLLRTLEMGLIYEEILHSLHVQAIMNPEVARDPAMERFAHEAEKALHDRVAAAGFVRRMLAGEMTPEMLRGLAERLQTAQRHWAEATRALRELLAKPVAAQVAPLQAMRGVIAQATPLLRHAVRAGVMLAGAEDPPQVQAAEPGGEAL